ncbi:MAG: superinfection immunity protein [Chloroflexota bacterium]|nr:superinfection immunity protein [Chloroflexota bacterium]
MDGSGAFLITIVSIVVYMCPTIIGFIRGQPNKWAIAALNVLLGWTVIGWIVALVWSLSAPTRQVEQPTIIVNQVQGDQSTVTGTEVESQPEDDKTERVSRKFKG